MRGILEAFPSVLRDLGLDGRAAEAVVFAAWNRCVDGVLAENVVPVRLEKDRLIAAVSSETWRRNVADLGPALAAKINGAIGSRVVSFVEFQVNADTVTSHRSRALPESTHPDRDAVAASLPQDLKAASESIEDEQLREQFLAAAAGSLARLERHRQTSLCKPDAFEG